jgi:DNA replication and repair protein RecF
LLYGPNGAGKTNVLEAVHYLCLSKSFLAARDRYALRQGSPYFEVEGRFEKRPREKEDPTTGEAEARSEREARLVYVPGEGKKIFLGGAPLDRLADVVGRLPVVVFSPGDIALTAEGPSERRDFVNNILSQERPAYLDDLMKYRRARRQRNEVLRKYKKRGSSPPAHLIEPWTEELVALGGRIVWRRRQFLEAFAGFLEKAYGHVETATERPTVEYDTIADLDPEAPQDEIAGALRDALERTRHGEEKQGRTLVGPQRDELVFRLGELEVRRYGSQGQHRTFGMALKLAQYFYLQERLEEPPLLLLDDAFGKLDASRTSAFLDLLKSEEVGQSLVTATGRAAFDANVPFGDGAHRALRVEAGEAGAQVHPPRREAA